LVLVAMVVGITVLNRLLQRAVEISFAKTAHDEAAHLEDEMRQHFNRD